MLAPSLPREGITTPDAPRVKSAYQPAFNALSINVLTALTANANAFTL